ncbi:MAG: ATP-binding protein, partial [Planctomycetota bacterium]
AEAGYDVLAIDADPDVNLASAFGIPDEQSPQPLIKMKELIAERTGTGRDTLGAYFKLNPKVSDVPQEYWIEAKGLKLLVLGAITQAGAGCACPEGAFLKALLTHTILQRAGVEFMGRASVQGIDALVLVVEPGSRSIETANNMAQMARKLGIGCVGAIANKIVETAQADTIASQLHDTVLLGTIEYSRALQEADLKRAPAFDADSEVTQELRRAKGKLAELIAHVKMNAE